MGTCIYNILTCVLCSVHSHTHTYVSKYIHAYTHAIHTYMGIYIHVCTNIHKSYHIAHCDNMSEVRWKMDIGPITYNFSHFAIYLPKIITIDGNLTKFSQK